ncbi:hypothetical protein D3C81_1478940 [compost metagenome]
MAERAVAEPLGILQAPVAFAAEDFGDAAGEVDRQGAEHGTGDGAHAWRADPADLLVGGGMQAAVAEVVEAWRPLGDPAPVAPLLHHFGEAAIAGGEVLRAKVQ